MVYSGIGNKDDLDNHSNQMNPNNDEYDNCRNGLVDGLGELIYELISEVINSCRNK